MLFNSIDFLIFFPVVTLLYFAFPHRFRWSLLLTASCIFYMAFIPSYILILFFIIVIDYFAGILLENAKSILQKKLFLTMSVAANIGILVVFKYYNFLNANFTSLLHAFDAANPLSFMNLVLPIGLSFHTFQAMSYTIEVYRGNYKAEKHFGLYALYVMFYPQLVAGPIERPYNLLPQLKLKQKFEPERLLWGLQLMAWGFVKKVVIADRLTLYVDEIFIQPENFHWLNLVLAAYFFYIQVYCDFSGYSDIAIGAALVMGIHLMQNFNRPIFSVNIRQFWARWNISLTSWFRDYVFTPMGGYRKTFARTCLNITVIFLLCGLWHGANWTFIVFGLIHAFYFIISLLYRKMFSGIGSVKPAGIRAFIPIFITFNLAALSCIFFRANSLHIAWDFIVNIFSFHDARPFAVTFSKFGAFSMAASAFSIIILLLVEYFMDPDFKILKTKPVLSFAFSLLCLIMILALGVFSGQNFIYFQF